MNRNSVKAPSQIKRCEYSAKHATLGVWVLRGRIGGGGGLGATSLKRMLQSKCATVALILLLFLIIFKIGGWVLSRFGSSLY